MKICLISFDYFNFDSYIIAELKRRGIETCQIDISKYEYNYKYPLEKTKNFFSKLLFNANIKKIKMEEFVLKKLCEIGKQDIILVIRPDRITKKTHIEIKKNTDKYIAYIYDSCNRFPINHLKKDIFDTIFSFDINDCKKFGFQHLSNYIYLEKKELKQPVDFKTNLFIISSIDERLPLLNKLANYCTNNKIKINFIIVGKKKPINLNNQIVYTNKNIFFDDLKLNLEEAKIFLDLVRKGQNGLSFRIFEALSYQRKIITSNQSIKEYDFYNPNNILVIDEKQFSIPKSFLDTPYEPLSETIYEKYTIKNWVNIVFKKIERQNHLLLPQSEVI